MTHNLNFEHWNMSLLVCPLSHDAAQILYSCTIMSYPSQPFSVQLSCYLGLMCSSCSCSKFRHLLPAPMDYMVGDDCNVHLYSSAEYGIGDSHPFILASPRCFAEDNRPLRHGSSSTSRNCGAVWLLSTLHTFFVFIAGIAVIFTFDDLMVLLISVLKCFVFTGHFISSAFCLFVSGWIQNMFHLCCCSQHECSFSSAASSLLQQALLHSTKDYHENYSA